MAKRRKTNFTHKDSLPRQAFLFDDGGDEISRPPLEGEVDARSAARGVTALTGARCSGIAEHPNRPPAAVDPPPTREGEAP
jgi:hypothetical protein